MRAKLTTKWTIAEKNALEHTFTAFSIVQRGAIKWPDFIKLPVAHWDTNSLKHFKAHWEHQLKKKRRRPTRDRLIRCIETAQAELMARLLTS